jgi:hypothetical protein
MTTEPRDLLWNLPERRMDGEDGGGWRWRWTDKDRERDGCRERETGEIERGVERTRDGRDRERGGERGKRKRGRCASVHVC